MRSILVWLLALALPVQGYAALALVHCAPAPVHAASGSGPGAAATMHAMHAMHAESGAHAMHAESGAMHATPATMDAASATMHVASALGDVTPAAVHPSSSPSRGAPLQVPHAHPHADHQASSAGTTAAADTASAAHGAPGSCSACSACCHGMAPPLSLLLPEVATTSPVYRSGLVARWSGVALDGLERPPRLFLA